MQQSQTSTPSKIKENNCPECLYLDLEERPVGKQGLFSSIQNQIDLHFTISFNEQWEDIGMGRIKFGIRGGELRLKLIQGKIPYNCRSFNDSLSLATDLEVEVGQGRENLSGMGASLAKDKWGWTAKRDEKQTASRKEKFQKTTSHISTKGSDEEPIWVFEASQDDVVLRGTLTEANLGTMEIEGNTYNVTATFEVSLGDVRLTASEGLPSDVSSNKLAWIERRIIFWLLKSKLKPYLSRVELNP